MATVRSSDGTRIGYDRCGVGSPVILVDGAIGYRALGFSAQLADLLASTLSAITYDRRGRGESGDTLPYALEREIEDIEALINQAGGSAYLYGISSGACLALEAAAGLQAKVKKLALYEPPYDDDASALPEWNRYWEQLNQFVSQGRSDDAVALFMAFVGVPAEMIDGMRQSPSWAQMTAVARTLPYDAIAIGEKRSVPIDTAAKITTPTLVMNGSESFPFMAATAEALARAIPDSRHMTLEGQRHDVSPQVLAPILTEFFAE